MEVSSVSSSINASVAASTQTQMRALQTQQDQQVQQARSTQQAQGAQSVDESEAAAQARTEAENNRPTVNTSGQVVGTRINTTA
jgi:hypothetical protein